MERVNSPLLSKQRLSVDVEGELVTLSIGNSTLKMPYETALQLSTWMRVRAKQAKAAAGDRSRHWSVIGVLDGLRT
jgi:hypothetical protein